MKKIDIISLETTLTNYKSRMDSQNKSENTQTVAQVAVQPDELATKPKRQRKPRAATLPANK